MTNEKTKQIYCIQIVFHNKQMVIYQQQVELQYKDIIMMIQKIIQTLLLILTLSYVCVGRRVSFINKHLSRYTVANDWNQIQSALSGQPIVQLQIMEGLICSEALDRLLNHKNIKNSLQSLRLNTTTFNQQIFSTFWSSEVVKQLRTLILDVCTIENVDIKNMANASFPNLQTLSLNNNFLTAEGFEHLSQVAIPNLKTFSIFGNSLVANKSIDSLIQLNLSGIQHFDIGFTGLSSQNAYRLINALNISILKTLNISVNTFNSEFYKNISQLNFSSLQALSIEDMLLDQKIVPYLHKMQFPSLLKLSIGRNWLFSNQLYTFLNKKNYPQLHYLSINSTLFDNQFLQYLAKQFKDTKFIGLYLSGHGITTKGFKYLLDLNTQNMKYLAIQRGMIDPIFMQKLIKNKQYPNLEELNIEYLMNGANTFSMIIQRTWPKLKKLKIQRIGKIDIIKMREIKRIIFPTLQFLAIDARQLSVTQIRQLVFFLTRVCYNNLHLELGVTDYQNVVLDIAQKAYINIPNEITLQLKKLLQQFINIDFYKVVNIALMPQMQPIIRFIDYKLLLEEIYAANNIDPAIDSTQAQNITQKILNNLNFTKCQKFTDSDNLTLLSQLIKIKEKNNQTCILPFTQSIALSNLLAPGFLMFQSCKFPNLKTLSLQFNNTFETNWSTFKVLNGSFRQIMRFILQMPTAPNSSIITNIFDQQKFDSLRELRLAKCNINSQELRKIFIANNQLSRLKLIYFESLKINKNLDFLLELDLHLRVLTFVHELVGDVVQQISTLNFQFIQTFHLYSVGLKNQKFVAFLQKMKEKGSSFPKLKDLRLGANMIQSQGTNKLFQFGLPLLQSFEMVLNKNPNELNDIFGSSSTGRLKGFMLYRNSEDSIDHNLDPKSTRSLSKLVVETGSLHETDYSKLAKMDFRYATDFVLIINRYFQCETFMDLANITKNSKTLYLFMQKEVQSSNSQCFNQNIIQTNYAFLTRIIIRVGNYHFSNLRNFSRILFKQPRVIESLQMQGVYPSMEDFDSIATLMNIDYLKTIDLESNDLQDQMIKKILVNNFPQLIGLSLKGNPRITSNAISQMKNKTYPQLEALVLSETLIDNAGLQILATCKFPKLNNIGLSNTQITGAGLIYLSKLNAPLLRVLDLSNNLIQTRELKLLDVANFKFLQTIIFYPNIYDRDFQQIKSYFNRNRPQRRKIRFATDVLHMQEVPNA